MSGPKKTSWQLRREQCERIKKERERKRQRQVNEILDEIKVIKSKIDTPHLRGIVYPWLEEVERDVRRDLRDAWRGIKGINNYITKQKRLQKEKEQQIAKELLEKQFLEEKIAQITDSLDSVAKEYKEILNDGIKQRVELFKNSIKTNPDNRNTLTQIEEFKKTLSKQYEEYQLNQDAKEYVAESLAEALNTNVKKGEDGSYEIQGQIDGVPISVNLNKSDSSIDMDTPTDGTCTKGLEALQQKLGGLDIDFGAIKVLKTGKVLNQNTIKTSTRIKA